MRSILPPHFLLLLSFPLANPQRHLSLLEGMGLEIFSDSVEGEGAGNKDNLFFPNFRFSIPQIRGAIEHGNPLMDGIWAFNLNVESYSIRASTVKKSARCDLLALDGLEEQIFQVWMRNNHL